MHRHIGIVGAGMIGLSTAWFLQERGFDVTVLERAHPGAGASWGNAGWLTPELTTPLPHPSVLAYGVRALLRPTSPVYVPPTADPRLVRFLTSFARHSTHRRWARAMRDYVPMNSMALDAFDDLTDGGVDSPTVDADPFLVCFRTVRERYAMLAELDEIRAAGQEVKADALDGDEVRQVEGTVSDEVGAALRIHGQRYLNPPAFVKALADAVQERGGAVVPEADVRRVLDLDDRVALHTTDGRERTFDAVVVANGAWMNRLVRPFGVRRLVQAGRGYSFSVTGDRLPAGPVYFPTQRVACTPITSPAGERRLRVAGMMEFRSPEAPLDHRRVDSIVEAVRPLFSGVDLDNRVDEWVGSRPCTPDGLPLIGRTRSPRVFAAGGHGMWGIAWGPLTGRLLAEQIATGQASPTLRPFDPLR
jgi:D-amino-acid dehydrogenase